MYLTYLVVPEAMFREQTGSLRRCRCRYCSTLQEDMYVSEEEETSEKKGYNGRRLGLNNVSRRVKDRFGCLWWTVQELVALVALRWLFEQGLGWSTYEMNQVFNSPSIKIVLPACLYLHSKVLPICNFSKPWFPCFGSCEFELLTMHHLIIKHV